jgi:hypothetical protein
MKKYLIFMFCLLFGVSLICCFGSKNKDSGDNAVRHPQNLNVSTTTKTADENNQEVDNDDSVKPPFTIKITTKNIYAVGKKPYITFKSSIDSDKLVSIYVPVVEQKDDEKENYALLYNFNDEGSSHLYARICKHAMSPSRETCGVQFKLCADGIDNDATFVSFVGQSTHLTFNYENGTWSLNNLEK